MPKVNVTRSVRCSAERAYAILADVTSYKEFLPFVKESTVSKAMTAVDGKSSAIAMLRLRAKKIGLDEKFASQVAFDSRALTIGMTSSDGPVKRLAADWKIRPTGPSSCELTLNADVSLKSLTMQFILTGALDYVVRKLFSAFEERAMSQAAVA
jgi:coenzyme Q-binding protein COQ10